MALFGVGLVVGLPLMFLTALLGPFGILVNLLFGVLGLGALALMVVLIMKTYQGEVMELPVTSDLVEKLLES